MVMRFADRVALLSAAANGIGAAAAGRLAAEGAAVVVTDIDDDAGEALVRRLHRIGATAWYRHADVTKEQDWREAVDFVLTHAARLDVLLLNAGRNQIAPIHEINDGLWNQQVDLGLTSVLLGMRACIGQLLETHGNVVLTSSIHAIAGFPGFPAYAAAKGAINALTRQLAVEYAPRVRVNAVVPGAIDTLLWTGVEDDVRSAVARNIPAGRFGRPREVAAAIAFLASDDASFITGTNLVVDGGRSIAIYEPPR